MTRDLLKDRERGEESDYFRKQDAKLIEKIRGSAVLQELAVALGEKLAVDDPALLQRIARLGITRETGAALLVAPLVQVAWAEGEVSEREREVILELAAGRGVVAGTPPYDQLLAWLQARPEADLFDTALEVLRVGFSVLPAAEREERIRGVLEGCERVADVSGGGLAKLLGVTRGMSSEESSLLDEFKRKLSTPGSST